MIRLRFLAAAVAAFTVFSACSSLAQQVPTWGLAKQFPAAQGYISAIYFQNPRIGIIGWHWNITNSTVGMVKRTLDSGKTWTNCTIGPGISNNSTPNVTDIWFMTPDSGWMTISGSLQSGDRWLWRTTDSGKTWNAINFDFGGGVSGLAAVWQTDSTLVVTQNVSVGVWYSQDTGKTWYSHATLHQNGLAFDHLLGVSTECYTSTSTTNFLTTTDGGVNWTDAIAGFKHEGWNVHFIPNYDAFIAVPEDTTQLGVSLHSKVYRSTTFGRSWTSVIPGGLPINTTGDVEGVDGILYVQSSGGIGTANPIDNMMESTDAGLTWFGVGGNAPNQVPTQGAADPYRVCDTRFAVTGCGNIVYVSDNAGGLWKTLDAPGLKFIDSNVMRPISGAICDTTLQLYFLHDYNSNPIIIQDIRILDSSRRPAKTGAVWIDSLPPAYTSIQVGDSVSFRLGWHPGSMMDSTGSDSATVRVIYYASYLGPCSEMKLAYDTVLMHVKLNGFSVPAAYAVNPVKIKTDTMPVCIQVDTSINLVNFGCDTLRVTQALLAKNAWALTDTNGKPLKLPILLLAGDTLHLRLRATPTSAALLYDSLQVKMHYEGHDTLWGVPMRTWAKLPIGPLATQPAVAFDSLATCDSTEDFITLSNTGCDTLFVSSATLADSHFELLDTNGNALKLPLAIPQDSARRLLVRFIPKDLGGKSGTIKLLYKYFGFDSTNLISLSGTGASSGTLAYAKALNFGNVSICSDTILTIDFKNTSCDWAHVTNLILSGPFVLIDSTLVPDSVPSGATLHLRVRYIPLSKVPEAGTAYLRAWTNDGQTGIADTIQLMGTGISGTSAFSTYPALTDSMLAFATRSQCDHTDSVIFYIHNTGCDTMSLTGLTLDPSLATIFAAGAGKALPATIAPGDSIRVTVAIVSLDSGDYSGKLHILFTDASGVKHDSIISAHETITAGSGGQTILNISSALIQDFGQIQGCSPADTTISVNYVAGCGTIVLHDSLTGTGFTLAGGDSIRISPGGTAIIRVSYDGVSRGTLDDTLHLASSSWPNPYTIEFKATVSPVDSVHFHASFSTMPIAAGRIFTASLVPDLKVSGRGLRTIHGSFLWRRDNFQVGQGTMSLGSGLPAGVTLSQSGPFDVGNISRYNFDVTSTGDLPLDPSTPIVSLPMMAMVSDSPGGLVAIDSIRLNQSDPTYSACSLASDGLATSTSLSIQCGDSTLIYFLSGKPIVLAERPRPDPVTSDNGYQTTVDISSAVDGIADIVLYDALGREVSRHSVALTHATILPYTFDLHTFAAGSYHYQVTIEGTGNSGIASGNMLLIK